MPLTPFDLTSSNVHARLKLAASRLAERRMSDYASSPERVEAMTLHLEGLYADFSRHRVDDEALDLLFELADEAMIHKALDLQFTGDLINETENRAVLHTALRSKASLNHQGRDIRPEINGVLDRMQQFTEAIHNRTLTGHTGKPITSIVNIGIGGSDLGPAMVYEALEPLATLEGFFVSNVDGADLTSVLKRVNPESTLFVIVSKTFTTQETLANAEAARQWLVQHAGSDEAVNHHFAAVSTNLQAASDFGISSDRVFGFWDWVGGRYSLWGAVGLSIALTCGWSNFKDLLDGAALADEHVVSAPNAANIPLRMALLGVWYRNYFNCASHAVIPYSHSLRRFPAYLQQADMESNGKSVGRDGNPIVHKSGPVIWGEPGTNGQHAFFQLLHQGTDFIPVDFICFAKPLSPLGDHHQKLLANCLAQAEALMSGKTTAQVVSQLHEKGIEEEKIIKLTPFKVFEGNRPSTLFIFDELSARQLGTLIALYEHKIFIQGVIWNLFSFDQWGVELGKELANKVLPMLNGMADDGADPTTAAAIRYIVGRQS
jgi:glucose-6-phosphate isomerase